MTSNSRAVVAALLGLLAIAAIPCGVLAAQKLASVSLLQSLYVSVPLAILLGLIAVLVARGARLRVARSVFGGRTRLARLAQILAWTGLWLGITGAVALAVYGALRWAQ
jgi:predicted permease